MLAPQVGCSPQVALPVRPGQVCGPAPDGALDAGQSILGSRACMESRVAATRQVVRGL